MFKKYFIIALAIFLTGFWAIAAEAETIIVTPSHIIKDQKDYYLDGHTWYNDGKPINSDSLFSTEESSAVESTTTESTTETTTIEASDSTKETTTETTSSLSAASVEKETSVPSSTAIGIETSTTTSVESSIENEQTSASNKESSADVNEPLVKTSKVERIEAPSNNPTSFSNNTSMSNRLPETGEKSPIVISFLGIVLIGCAIFLFNRRI